MLTKEEYEARLKAVQKEKEAEMRRLRNKRYRESCKESRKAYLAKWRAEHPDYFKNYHKNRRDKDNDRRNEQSTDDA